jgi:hypothetical protein
MVVREERETFAGTHDRHAEPGGIERLRGAAVAYVQM